MRRRAALIWKALAVVALGAVVLAPATPAFAAGFSIFEQGSKAMGMADAVTAQSDDPSAIFYNAGGVAFIDKPSGAVGATYITETRASFHGAAPFPGPGVTASEKRLQVFPPHLYWVQPITPQWKLAIGVETPFGLTTQWKNPDTFAGRFLSTKAAIKDFDINPTLAWQVTPELGIGIGGIARVSSVELERFAPAINPFTFTVINAAKVKLTSDYDTGYGFDAGFLHKPTSWLSWGASYRSQIDVDYTGSAVLFPRPTGNPILDAILAAQLPFNTKIAAKTKVKYPAQASLGFAVKPTPQLTVEVDGNWFGWKHFDTVPLNFPDGQLPSSVIIERWKDSYAVRAGLNWASSPTWQWRLGYVFDQSPQPEQTVNPLLPDANRNGVTAGIGYRGGAADLDLAVMYLFFADRTRAKSFPDDPLGPFFGTYSTRALLVSLTVGFHY
jgi:long-chain fatty acid transport protein